MGSRYLHWDRISVLQNKTCVNNLRWQQRTKCQHCWCKIARDTINACLYVFSVEEGGHFRSFSTSPHIAFFLYISVRLPNFWCEECSVVFAVRAEWWLRYGCQRLYTYLRSKPNVSQNTSRCGQAKSDHIPIMWHLHLALTCVFPYPDNLSGHRSHFNTRCKWVRGVNVKRFYWTKWWTTK